MKNMQVNKLEVNGAKFISTLNARISIISLGLLVLVNVSCQSRLPKDEYIIWMKDYSNGIHKKREINKIIFDVQYKPHDFVVLNEKGRDSSFVKNKVNEMEYFTLKINMAGGKEDFLKYGNQSEREYYDRLYYYAFNFQNDIYMEEAGKILPCKLFHFERSYDLTNSRTFVLAFDKTGNRGDKTLVIDSRDLGLGPVKINFEKKDLESIPQLKI